MAEKRKMILVPVDGSANAVRALEYVAERKSLGEDFDVTAVTVTQYETVTEAAAKMGTRKAAIPKGDKVFKLPKVRALLTELKAKTLMPWDDDPAAAIMRAAKTTKSREIVMGTRGLGRLKGLVMGSVSTKVVQLSPVPVTLVK